MADASSVPPQLSYRTHTLNLRGQPTCARCYDSRPHHPHPQRENWNGDTVDLGDAWVLRKGEQVARCSLVTHPLVWELRVDRSDLVR